MTDSEKLALIKQIIWDFYDWNGIENQNAGAIHVLNTINTILKHTGKEKE